MAFANVESDPGSKQISFAPYDREIQDFNAYSNASAIRMSTVQGNMMTAHPQISITPLLNKRRADGTPGLKPVADFKFEKVRSTPDGALLDTGNFDIPTMRQEGQFIREPKTPINQYDL